MAFAMEVKMKTKELEECKEEIRRYKTRFPEEFNFVSSGRRILDFGDKFATCRYIKDIKKINKRYYIITLNKISKGNTLLNVKLTKLGEHYRINYYVTPKNVANKRIDYTRYTDAEKVEKMFNNYLKSTEKYRNYDEYGIPCENYEGEFEEHLRIYYKYLEIQKDKNKKDSIRRSKQRIYDLAMCNPQLDKFVTLTYAEEEFVSYERAYDEFKKFRDRFQKYLKRNFNFKFEYLAVFETQRSGRWHIHMLCNVPAEYINYRSLTIDECFTGEEYFDKRANKIKKCVTQKAKDLNFAFQVKFWQQGYVQYVPLADSSGSAFYISKYLSKECDVLSYKEKIKKRYLCSKGLIQPQVMKIYEDEVSKEIEDKKNSTLAYVLKEVSCSDKFTTRLNVYDEFLLCNNYNDNRKILQVDYRKKINI